MPPLRDDRMRTNFNNRKEQDAMTLPTVQKLWNRSRSSRDLIIVVTLAIIVFAFSATFDLFNKIISWIYQHDTWQLDEVFTVTLYLVIAIGVYAWRRHKELVDQTRRREQVEAEKALLLPELEKAREDVATLRRIIPVCPSCKRIRDTRGEWYPMETYIEIHYLAKFNDGLCPRCAREAYNGPLLHRQRSS